MAKIMIGSGDLRHHMVLQKWKQAGVDEHGQPAGQWVSVNQFWAKLEPVQGRQIEYARQLYNRVTHLCTFRFQPDITVNDRMIWSDRVFAIGFIANLEERNVWLRLFLAEDQDAKI